MKQSKLASLFETLGGTALGFALALVIQHAVNWWFRLPLSDGASAGVVGVFTVASLLRGFAWRRFCEWINVRRRLTPAMQAVIGERFRQGDVEGFDAEHDDRHAPGELARAGACYILNAALPSTFHGNELPPYWPWEARWWKPQGFWRDLVRGVALVLAEMDRALRLRRRRP